MDSGDVVTSMRTGFSLGGGMILTAGHVLTLDEKDEDYAMIEAMACNCTLVTPLDFEDADSEICFGVQPMSIQMEWDDLTQNDGPKGCLIRVLIFLPVSPTYFTSDGKDEVHVFSTSFPRVNSFLDRIEEELNSTKESSIWDCTRRLWIANSLKALEI
ncbi:hypothetical protein L7F22_032672 [Adiantum nelumboides]|nr:hypothetical protein [Adiantum nelumboides]